MVSLSHSSIPTVELHRHFEAGIHPRQVAALARKGDIRHITTRSGQVVTGFDPKTESGVAGYYEWVQRSFQGPEGFGRFIDSFGLPLQCLKTLEDLEQAAFSQVCEQAAHGSLHVELRGSPFSYQAHVGAPLEEIVHAIRRGVWRAWQERGASGSYIASFSRQNAFGGDGSRPEKNQAKAIVALVLKLHRPDFPLGLDIAGFPEVDYPPAMFEKMLAPLREAKIPLTIHSGEQGRAPHFETTPPTLTRQAVEVLQANRIGHGTCLLADPELRALVKDRGVGIECCPVSNYLMGFLDSLSDHPLPLFLSEGLLASVATDDPLMFQSSSVRSLLDTLEEPLQLGPEHRWKLAENGLKTAFVSESRRSLLLTQLRSAKSAWVDQHQPERCRQRQA